jgi:hypothetical protein
LSRAEQLISLAALTLSIELVLFKFLPDIGTAAIQHSTSALTSFAAFEQMYLTPQSVHHARFLGNYILYDLARLFSQVFHSADPRLHPLRVAAGILTPVYALIGAFPAVRNSPGVDWRYFLVPYGLATLIGLYVFYPGDMPSLACISLALWLLLEERMLPALLWTLVAGLFRESAFHMVWLVAAWAWCASSRPLGKRLAWLSAFALAFALEYVAVRRFFPGPVSASGGITLDPRTLLDGLLSITVICSLGLAILFPLACLLRVTDIPAAEWPKDDWRRRFFLLNCCVFPLWIVFYRMLSANISEFRVLLPALLPCIYGIACQRGRKAYSNEDSWFASRGKT